MVTGGCGEPPGVALGIGLMACGGGTVALGIGFGTGSGSGEPPGAALGIGLTASLGNEAFSNDSLSLVWLPPGVALGIGSMPECVPPGVALGIGSTPLPGVALGIGLMPRLGVALGTALGRLLELLALLIQFVLFNNGSL